MPTGGSFWSLAVQGIAVACILVGCTERVPPRPASIPQMIYDPAWSSPPRASPVSPPVLPAQPPARLRTTGSSGLRIDDVSLRCREDFFSGGFSECTVTYALSFALPPTGTYSISYDCSINLRTSHPADVFPQQKYGNTSGFVTGLYGQASDFGSTSISVTRIVGDNPTRVVVDEFECRATRTRIGD